MLPLKSIAFLLSFFSASACSLLVPVVGIANYILIYQIYPEHAWWHKAIESLGLRYSMTAAVCLMVGMLISLPRMPSVRPIVSLWDLLAMSLTLCVMVSEFVAPIWTTMSSDQYEKYMKMMVFVFCLTRVTTTKRNFEIVIRALVLGSLYIGYDAWTAPKGAFAYGRLQRIGGPDFRHSSGLAVHMAGMLPLIAVAFMTTRSKMWKTIAAFSGALTVNTIILCRTRSAFVGLAGAGVVALLMAPKRRRLRTYAALIVAGGCAYALTDNLYWERMSTLRDREAISADPAATGRLDIWRAATKLIAEYPLGVGVGNFGSLIGTIDKKVAGRAAHNTYILCWAEWGTHGIILFTALLATSIVQVRQCQRHAHLCRDPHWIRYMSYGVLLAIVGSLVAQLFTERLYTEAFWWLLAMPSCLSRVTAREMAMEQMRHQSGAASIRHWARGNPLLRGSGTALPALGSRTI